MLSPNPTHEQQNVQISFDGTQMKISVITFSPALTSTRLQLRSESRHVRSAVLPLAWARPSMYNRPVRSLALSLSLSGGFCEGAATRYLALHSLLAVTYACKSATTSQHHKPSPQTFDFLPTRTAAGWDTHPRSTDGSLTGG